MTKRKAPPAPEPQAEVPDPSPVRKEDLGSAVDRVIAQVGGFGHPVTVEDCVAVRDMIRAEVANPRVVIDVYHTHDEVRIFVGAGEALVWRTLQVQGLT